MEISIDELNELLQKEYERGKGERLTVYTPYSQQIKDWLNYKNPYKIYTIGNTPEACKNCSNHPSNGGSGICSCTLGLTPIKCTTNELECYSVGNGVTYTISKTTDNIK